MQVVINENQWKKIYRLAPIGALIKSKEQWKSFSWVFKRGLTLFQALKWIIFQNFSTKISQVLGGYRGSKSMPSQKGVSTNSVYHETAQRQLASLTQMSAKCYMRSTKGIKLSAAIKA